MKEIEREQRARGEKRRGEGENRERVKSRVCESILRAVVKMVR